MSSPPSKKSKTEEQEQEHNHSDHPGKDCCSLAHEQDWVVTALDSTLAKDVEDWLPEKIFDQHAHLWELDQFSKSDLEPKESAPALITSGPVAESAGWEAFTTYVAKELHAGKQTSGLLMPFPHTALDVPKANDFVAAEATTADDVRRRVKDDGFVGLKCYHVWSPVKPTFDAAITDFMPEHLFAVAHELKLSVTLHMVRYYGLSDKGNQETIREMCTKYPDMRLVLAHAARGFNMFHAINGLESLKGLKNVYFDTAVVCESPALEAIINTFGHDRLLYGSDFPVTHSRGRAVTLGDSFFWINNDVADLKASYAETGAVRTALVAVEAMRALKVACDNLKLTRVQVQDIFYGNAARLYNLPAA